MTEKAKINKSTAVYKQHKHYTMFNNNLHDNIFNSRITNLIHLIRNIKQQILPYVFLHIKTPLFFRISKIMTIFKLFNYCFANFYTMIINNSNFLHILIRFNLELIYFILILIFCPKVVLLRLFILINVQILQISYIKKKNIKLANIFLTVNLMFILPLIFSTEYLFEKSESDLLQQHQMTDNQKKLVYYSTVIGIGFAVGFLTYYITQKGIITVLDNISNNPDISPATKQVIANYVKDINCGSLDRDLLGLGIVCGSITSFCLLKLFPVKT